VLLACWLAGALTACGLTWHAIGPHQPLSWVHTFLGCAIVFAAAGWLRHYVLRSSAADGST
jgi:hypothetical protein